ncbi:dTMP kinase [bacterium]|nr:dTMP kinase [bacterium]
MDSRKRGFFITFEGPDGSGKSTQFKLLAESLKQSGLKVVETREPGGHPLAEKIRLLLLANRGTPPAAETELLLFLAARAQHVRALIQPALTKRYIVLCERFADSTYAYQVGGRGLSPRFVTVANRFATNGIKPDLTLLFDINVTKGLRRAFRAKQGHDRMESEPLIFARRVRQAYLEIACREPRRVCRIQADRPVKSIAREVWNEVWNRLQSTKRDVQFPRSKERGIGYDR